VAVRSQSRRALVTGITGQDGSFLAEVLLERGYQVTGISRHPPSGSLGASEHLRGRIELIQGDLLDSDGLRTAVTQIDPHELYHLAAPSFVPDSWRNPRETVTAVAGSTAALLEVICDCRGATRAFFAGSSAMFGDAPESPQHEDTCCHPQSPYATAKLAAHELVGQLRTHHGIFACSGILYNHESERRPESFVTRKITRAAAAIKLGMAEEVVLGDLDAVRDWSFAGDVMHGAWLMLQQDRPDDFILASGVGHTVRQVAEVAFGHLGLNAEDHVRVDPKLVRGPETTLQVGDPSRARDRLGWRPSLTFAELVQRMVDADLRGLQAQTPLR
jgi:GDPmannose 4,6-dehydratase